MQNTQNKRNKNGTTTKTKRKNKKRKNEKRRRNCVNDDDDDQMALNFGMPKMLRRRERDEMIREKMKNKKRKKIVLRRQNCNLSRRDTNSETQTTIPSDEKNEKRKTCDEELNSEFIPFHFQFFFFASSVLLDAVYVPFSKTNVRRQRADK